MCIYIYLRYQQVGLGGGRAKKKKKRYFFKTSIVYFKTSIFFGRPPPPGLAGHPPGAIRRKELIWIKWNNTKTVWR